MKAKSIEEQELPETPAPITKIPGAPDPAAKDDGQAIGIEPEAPSAIEKKLEAWFAKHFHGLGSMLDERLYNHIRAAVEDLKAEFRQL